MTVIPKGQKKAKLPTLARLKRDLDTLWSVWTRRRNSTLNGYIACVSCGVSKHWKEQQCGHYVSRVHLACRWDERNCAPQCGRCNVLLNGNYIEYTVWMVENWGYSVIEDLRELKHTSLKISRSGYEERIAEVKALIAGLDEAERLAA